MRIFMDIGMRIVKKIIFHLWIIWSIKVYSKTMSLKAHLKKANKLIN